MTTVHPSLNLLPAPTSIEHHGGRCRIPPQRTISGTLIPPGWKAPAEGWTPWATVVHTPMMMKQGYHLRIIEDAIEIMAGDEAGIRHACATIDQLCRQFPSSIPTCSIRDAPRFLVRGVMLDVSRDRIPTMDEFRRIIPQLASWKINHLQLYVEHTVAYAGLETVWAGLDPLTLEELREIDGLCARYGIELAANQNCFGHLSGVLRHPSYQHLAEIPADGSWDFNGLVTRTGPFSLCPGEPQALTFVANILGQLCPAIASPWVNIGCDETFDVGQGRSREAVAKHGRAAVYLDFVRKICDVVRNNGKKPQFWADIALEHPEYLAELPADLLGIAWGYEGDAAFAGWCDQLNRAGRSAWVSPGTSSWRSITGRTADRRANLLAAVAAHSHGASGFLVTDWGDLGHRQQWPVAAYALAEAAHRAWSADAPFDPRVAGTLVLGNPELGPWMDAIGDVDLMLRQVGGRTRPDGTRSPLRNATVLFTELHSDEPYIGSREEWAALDATISELGQQRPISSSTQLNGELSHVVAIARFACLRAVARRGGTPLPKGLLQGLVREHKRLWLARSRPGGLASSCAHYERIPCD